MSRRIFQPDNRTVQEGSKIVILQGKLFAESPIYRGNARKTLFTRDGDGTQRLVSLAGEVAGTAQTLMDAFIGESRTGKNTGLLHQMWLRLYGSAIPAGLVTRVECSLREEHYPRDRFFDLRMGIKLDEDRWAAEANANYKMETLYRNSVFNFTMHVDDPILKKGDNAVRLYYVLEELKAGRFWFGAGKSKGLGRCRLEMDLSSPPSETLPPLRSGANHLTISLTFNTTNPVLVGWNWGKLDPDVPAFAAIESRLLVEAMRDLPKPIRKRLEMSLGGPILNPEDWKNKLAEYLPRVIGAWLASRSAGEEESWIFPSAAVERLGEGKHSLSGKVLKRAQSLVDKPFPSREAAEEALIQALKDKANMAKRILDVLEHKKEASQRFDEAAWLKIADALGMDKSLSERLAPRIQDEEALIETLSQACRNVLPRLYRQVDQQIHLLQSDAWVDAEIEVREEHLRIKTMLLKGEIDEGQWGDSDLPPEGIRTPTWKEFLDSHSRVRFQHMMNPKNLQKSIVNDRNMITFLKSYRDRTRQELAQPYHTDFRAGGASNREISRKYGKAYDTVFMRMLSWAPSSQGEGLWEIYIPGSTIKGAFRKRASQVLRTLWGESNRTTDVINRLFGAQGQRGMVLFSDGYLTDPEVPKRSWCSMDGVRMDPRTGRPIEQAKADYLYAYGDKLSFQLRLDLQDIHARDMEALSVFLYLLRDFQNGDIPLGGEKANGFGWVKAQITELEWRTASDEGQRSISRELFGEPSFVQDGIWQKLHLEGESAQTLFKTLDALTIEKGKASQNPPKAAQGFVSHRAFGGYCGILSVEAEVLTPLSVQESGEPSHTMTMDGEPVNGWDFFSMASPEAALRDAERVYALPSKSLKGMLRHIFSIASDSAKPSPDITRLNPADSLFGWVGKGPNQALMGRLSFSFGTFDKPELSWFKVPYPYGAF